MPRRFIKMIIFFQTFDFTVAEKEGRGIEQNKNCFLSWEESFNKKIRNNRLIKASVISAIILGLWCGKGLFCSVVLLFENRGISLCLYICISRGGIFIINKKKWQEIINKLGQIYKIQIQQSLKFLVTNLFLFLFFSSRTGSFQSRWV